MKLERVEELCLNYLTQNSVALVPVNAMLEHCRRDPECAQLSLDELLDFLRHHELVHVVERPALDSDEEQELISDTGFDLGPRAILHSRMPSREEIAAAMQENLERMSTALASALREAERAEEDPATLRQIKEAIEKASALRGKIEEMF